jgi:mono/diheme cytochrome c family protein
MGKAMLGAVLLLALACGAEPPPQDVDGSPESAAAVEPGHGADAASNLRLTAAEISGREVYETLCWSCHGRSGRGDGPAVRSGAMPAPPNFQASAYAQVTEAELRNRVDDVLERADPSNPHMEYVTSVLRPERFAGALAYIPALLYPAEIPGSALIGQDIFRERCAPCHGASGDGHGAVEDQLLVPAADLTHDSIVAARDFDQVFALVKRGGSETVHGSSMPAWGLVFDDGTIWDLVAYLATLQPGALDKSFAAR